MQNGMGCRIDQILTVVDALDSNARWQDSGGVDALDLRFHPLDRGGALLATAHQNDALDDIVVVVLPRDAEARLMSNDDCRDVTNEHRVAADLRQHRVVDVVDRPNKANAANDGRL